MFCTFSLAVTAVTVVTCIYEFMGDSLPCRAVAFHLKREATVTIGDDGGDALTPLISSSPSSPPTESATAATIATVTLPPPILPSQPSQPEAKSFALARFQNRWYNEAAKKN